MRCGGWSPTPPSTGPAAVAVPLNPQLTRPEVERMLDHCGAVVALVEESLARPVPEGGATRW